MKKAKIPPYFNVVKVAGSDSADILLYGAIGQDYWWRDDKEESITDLEVVKAIRSLEQDYDRINIRINSPGGSIYHGNAIINAIRSSKAEIHTYNDGMAASMAGLIWLASEKRHMSSNALLMIHAPSSGVWGNVEDMGEAIKALNKFESTLVATISEATGLEAAEIKATWFDFKDHWLNAADCQAKGFIPEPEEYEAQDVIEDPAGMSFISLLEAFAHKGDALATRLLESARRLPDKALNALRLGTASQEHSHNQTRIQMKKEDLQQSFEKGELSPEDLTALLSEAGYEVTPPAKEEVEEEAEKPTAQQPDLTLITDAIKAATQPLTAKIEELENKLAQYGKLPGAQRSDSHASEDNHADLSEEQIAMRKEQDAYNQEAARLADLHINPFTAAVD